MPRFPRRPVHPAFRRAVLTDQRGIVRLSAQAGWSCYPNCSRLLHARAPRCTPLTITRFQALAALVGYTGDIFKERQS